VPKTATEALSGVTIPYAVKIANVGVEKAIENSTIKTGVNTYHGKLTEKAVANSLNLPFTDVETLTTVLE